MIRPEHSWLAWCLVTLLLGCTSRPAVPPEAERPAPPAVRACEYDIALRGPAALAAEVEVRCQGSGLSGFAARDPLITRHVSGAVAAGGTALGRDGERWLLPAGAEPRLSYRIDLAALATEAQRFDLAQQVGGSWIGRLSSLALHPEPLPWEVPITLRFALPEGLGLATAMPRSGGAYHLRAEQLAVGTYVVFGRFETQELTVGEGEQQVQLKVITLDAPLAATPRELSEWISRSLLAVSSFWRRAPVERLGLFVVPAADRGVVRGQICMAGGAALAVTLGDQSEAGDLQADWVLVHELFHLGVPSFAGEGMWLDEGLATYYEPLIRARAGWRTEEQLWAELGWFMSHSGLPVIKGPGLEAAAEPPGIYWAGALMALLADVEARRRSGGRLGLEDGLREVLARGGSAAQVWKLEQVIGVIDAVLPGSPLADLWEAHRRGGGAIDLAGLLRDLGVEQWGDGITLDDSAPLAELRRQILHPPAAGAGRGNR